MNIKKLNKKNPQKFHGKVKTKSMHGHFGFDVIINTFLVMMC